jgi:hypothetical protein
MTEFISGHCLSKAVQLSPSSLYRCRRQHWQPGIHYQKLGHRQVLYNLPLILDWIANRGSPELHERAIRLYLANLPSSQRK